MALFSGVVRLGRDAEIKTVGSDKLCAFSGAYETGYGDKKQTHWIDAVLWGKRGEAVAPYLTKGTLVELYGEPSIRTYESKGATKAVLQVRVDNVKLHGGKKSDDGPVADRGRATRRDDDIPF